MSNSPERSSPSWRKIVLVGGGLLVILFCVWILMLIPGTILILGSGQPRQVSEKQQTPSIATHTVTESMNGFATQPKKSRTPEPTASLARLDNTLPAYAATQEHGGWSQLNDGKGFPQVVISALQVDPSDPEKIYAGTAGAGIYISNDGGDTWAASNAGLGKGTVGGIAIHSDDPDIVYASLTEQGGVYKSSDGGGTWQAENTGLDLGMNWGWTALLAIAPSSPNVLYFTATNSGVYRSEDSGSHWFLRSRDCPQATSMVVDPRDSAHIFVSSRDFGQESCPPGIYESPDAGQTWDRLSTDEMSTGPGNNWGQIAGNPNRPEALLAALSGGTYLTEDSGKSWLKVNETCEWLAVDPDDGAFYCRKNEQLWISRDGGKAWEQSGIFNAPNRLSGAPAAFPSGLQTVYIGDNLIKKSSGGGENWQDLGSLGSARFQIDLDPTDRNRLYLTAIDKPGNILRSQDAGETWQAILEWIEPGGRLSVSSSGTIIYPNPTGTGQALFRSNDNGFSWERVGQGHPINAPRQILIDPLNPERVWMVGECGGSLAVSENNGGTFSQVPGGPEGMCQAILVADPTGQTLYVIGWGGTHRTQDGGQSWVRLAAPGGIPQSALVDPRDGNTVYVGSTHRGVMKSIDGGETWQPANTGLSNLAINDLKADPNNPGVIYAASDNGVFVTEDGGSIWRHLEGAIGTNPMVYSLEIAPGDPGLIYAVTPDGVFRMYDE